MRKFVTFLTTGLLALMCCATVVSAKTNPDVSYTEKRSADTTYKVSVMTNGKATNGVIEIAYDAEVLACEETDVVVSSKVDLYSVNVEDGVVKISYSAENSLPAGTFSTVSFDVAEAYADEKVSAEVSCVSYDKKGNELTTGPKVEDKRPGNNGNTGDYEDDENQKPDNGKENTGNNKKPGKKEDNKKSENTNPVTEGTVEEVQTEETVQTEQSEQSELMEQATELRDEEVPLAAMTEETSHTPVLVIVLVVLCAVAAGVVFFVKRKTVE